MRLGCDTGGTFTDLVVEEDDGSVTMHKAPTTPRDPAQGVLAAIQDAATARGESLLVFLSRATMFVHGTTHAINAIITGSVARTALLTTAGHRDMLVLREGGRADAFDHGSGYPRPYVPRALTFGIPERIDAAGRVIVPLDEAAVLQTIARMRELRVEAVGVCLLWSIANPAHERRIAELLEQHLPDAPCTLSHTLSPTLREYRRASATCIDASLKPLMTAYLGGLDRRLRAAGFDGRLLVLTSQGGMIDAAELALAPIHSINSGPSAAPVAASHFARLENVDDDVIVADTGGTTYDVSLVRNGRIPYTRETWIGEPYLGHMTGFPSVDVRSVGAGGGSIARVDAGGVLHVGPESAGSTPGPVCYARGGERPTLTDACVTLGYIDPEYFLGGAMQLDRSAAEQAIQEQIARPLGLALQDAAAAIVDLATESMVQAIADITINQGVDPTQAVLVGGGGAAGLNCIAVARRLGCPKVIIPELGAAMSAGGGLISDLAAEHSVVHFSGSDTFDMEAMNSALARLERRCERFLERAGAPSGGRSIEFSVEARYPGQVWEIETPLECRQMRSPEDLAALVARFHAEHRAIFAIDDPHSPIEIVRLIARARCPLRQKAVGRLQTQVQSGPSQGSRRVYFSGAGWVQANLLRLEQIESGESRRGPAIVETPFTTIVLDPGSRLERSAHGSLIISLQG